MFRLRPPAPMLRVAAICTALAALACDSQNTQVDSSASMGVAPKNNGRRANGDRCSTIPIVGTNEGVAGPPETNPQIFAYADTLCFGDLTKAKKGEDTSAAEGHKKATNRDFMIIMPEAHMLNFPPASLPIGHGVIVALVENVKSKNNGPILLDKWLAPLPEDGVAFLWFGRRAGTGADTLYSRLFMKRNSSVVVIAEGTWQPATHTAAVRPPTYSMARWQPLEKHSLISDPDDAGWVTCLSGCCTAGGIFLDIEDTP